MNSIRTDAKTLEAMGEEAYSRGFRDGRELAAQEALAVMAGNRPHAFLNPLRFVVPGDSVETLRGWFTACGVLK